MSSIAQSLGPLKLIRQQRASGRPDAQTLKLPGVQTSGRLDARTARRADSQTAGNLDTWTPGSLDVQTPGLPLQGSAKRSHPDFSKRTIYVRDRTHREALRKYEDGGGREFSELVETLLQQYVGRPGV